MFDWKPKEGTSTASLHPYFSFGNPTSPFFRPWEDVGKCLKELLLHQFGSQQSLDSITLVSHETHIFIATAHNYSESKIARLLINVPGYYLLRCHHDAAKKNLVFGYHLQENYNLFHKIVELSLNDDNWRLDACIVLKNLARILLCLKHYTVPLIWSRSTKLSLDLYHGEACVRKVYPRNNICDIFNATVTNMIDVYNILEKADVPHTDRLVSVEEVDDGETKICNFAPIGRSYLPENLDEMLDALICVAEALVALHALKIMHRDIRWANVFHVHNGKSFTKEWILFDFEFAAVAPQRAFGAHTLTPGNHAPEMVDTEQCHHTESHDTAVDIWGLGFLILHANVDIPASHLLDLQQLRADCLHWVPGSRPSAKACLEILRELKARPCSPEKEIDEVH
jgi:Protein kinase domain